MKYFLVTTADQRTWKFDRPVIFLGEWCTLYHQKAEYEKIEHIVAPPFGLADGQKELDRIYLHSLIANLQKELATSLNQLHNVEHSDRYWNIVLGHWIQRFVYVAFNRFHCLQTAINNHDISGTAILNLNNYKLATKNSIDFIWALYDDEWDHVFYSRVINFLEFKPIDIVDAEASDGFVREDQGSLKTGKIESIREGINKVLRLFVKKTDAFIIKSYLPVKQVVEFQLALKQIPTFWASPETPSFDFDESLRMGIKLNYEGYSGFEKFVRKLLPEAIPTCYVEGYFPILELCSNLPWPSHPKFVFTSNNFDTDEVFKIWTAQKVKDGVPYYVGQHGNNYGTWTYSLEMPEIATPDKFISWGWHNDIPNVKPAFIFNTIGKATIKNNSNGGLLLVERCLHSRQTTFDNYYENNFFQEEQFRFVNTLTLEIKEKLLVRMHTHKLSNLKWSDLQRWNDYDPNISLELGKSKVWDLIQQNRLVVFSYDSTGLLEALSINIPVIGFWYHLFEELLPEAIPYYKLLLDVGILFENPEDAANHVNKNWNCIDEWWFSDEVQKARQIFCDRYARTVKSPLSMLKKILIDEI